jgi:hypothetical protein
MDILPDRSVLLQLGTKRFVAMVDKVDPPLKLGQDYLFQIQKNTNPIQARVVRNDGGGEEQRAQSMSRDVILTWHLKDDQPTARLVQMLLDHGIPLKRPDLVAARALLSGGGRLADELQAVRWLMNRNLPLEPAFFRAASALTGKEPLLQRLTDLRTLLSQFGSSAATPGEQKLLAALNRLPESGGGNRELIVQVMRQLGFEFEHQLLQQTNADTSGSGQESIKARLLSVIADSKTHPEVRTSAQELVRIITGEQLQIVSADPQVAQLTLQLPIPWQRQLRNASIYWEGKRTKEGRINPDTCHIVLYLHLTHLKETLISIRVRDRRVSISVQNETEDISKLLENGRQTLGERLAQLNYQLQSVSQAKTIDKHVAEKVGTPLSFSTFNLDVKI